MAEAAHSTILPKRGFLRGLLSLPFIGGGLALLGAPRSVALTPDLAALDAYIAFLAREHVLALAERDNWISPGYHDLADHEKLRCRVPLYWFPKSKTVEAALATGVPSSRAALVLSSINAMQGES